MNFFEIDNKGNVTILHYKLIEFLANNGFAIMGFPGKGKILVKVENNIIHEVVESDIVKCIQDYLVKLKLSNVLEKFTKGLSGYVNGRKYDLLPELNGFSDKDSKGQGYFYYQNVAVRVCSKKIEIIPYGQLPHKIWNERIVDRNFKYNLSKKGQFEDFCFKLSKSDLNRFLALKSALGYLLHRYNNPSLCKVVILVDEKISFSGQANGGTGKSLISKALSYMQNVLFIEGKNLKTGSWFKNQRIEMTTDLIAYDDVGKDFSIETIFSELTSGIVVERKRKDEIHISAKDAPKYLISSNYIVKGPGGSSDERRRYEFELSDYFVFNSPKNVYGNLLFDEWDSTEWERFDNFMHHCLQTFLTRGLIEAQPINLKQHRLINATCIEFEEFSQKIFKVNEWMDKRKILGLFIVEYPHLKDTSSHLFTKWIKEYSRQNSLKYSDKSSGGVYSFILKSGKGGSK
ncbi:hypothetical protein [Seonamhaeicola marinus]|uniref:Uncharacterized protein n=1 Tax=Seonamhaeicola marinus TaxID=1912246 RepID=A0A5D0HVU2_9FLAO|nr:hypothetical protein [Seonamhaeicola marinus]TYA74237.1 hypothetical protein FUA24_12965 [Seonamhaeicola marinus]